MSPSRQTIASVVIAVVVSRELALRSWEFLRPLDILAYKASFVIREVAAEYDRSWGWRHRANRK
jgi:hypothetical protein